MEAVEAPDVVGMAARPDDALVEPEILAIDGFGLGDPALLEEQGAERMPHGLHPAPRLVVGEVVLQPYRLPEVVEGVVVAALPVLDFAVEHCRRDLEHVEPHVVEQGAGRRDPRHGGSEALLLPLGRGDVTEGRVGHGLRIVRDRGGDEIEVRVRGERLGEDLPPAPEADERVELEAVVALQHVRHRRALDPDERLRDGGLELLHRFHRGTVVTEKQGAVELEVEVVDARVGIEVEGPVALEVLAVARNGGGVPGDDLVVAPALEVDVGRHVVEVPAISREREELVPGTKRRLRGRGHLHQVDVVVEHPGVGRPPRRFPLRHRPLEHVPDLARRGAGPRLTGLEIPELPGGARHEGVGEEGADVRIARKLAVDPAHGVRVGLRPDREVGGLAVRGAADRHRLHERPFHPGRPVAKRERPPGRGMGHLEPFRPLGRVELLPLAVVVGARRVGDAPVRHGAVGIRLGGAAKAAQRLLEVEAVGPREAVVEPRLRVGRAGRDRAGIRPGIEVVVQRSQRVHRAVAPGAVGPVRSRARARPPRFPQRSRSTSQVWK